MIYISLTNWKEKYLVEQAKMEGWQNQCRNLLSEIDHLSDLAEQQRQEHRAELRRREVLTDQQQASLFAQIQAMAERLASLKLGVDPDPKMVKDGQPLIPFDARKPVLPWSAGLFSFVNAIDSEEAKGMVEDFIEMQRNEGMDDEQILDKLNRGEYDG